MKDAEGAGLVVQDVLDSAGDLLLICLGALAIFLAVFGPRLYRSWRQSR